MMAEVVNPSQVKVLVVNAMRGMVCKSVAITTVKCVIKQFALTCLNLTVEHVSHDKVGFHAYNL